jgi:hypothetical protein
MTHNTHFTTQHNRGRHLEAVPPLPEDATYSVVEPPKRLNWDHIRNLGSLPDNVFLLPVRADEPPEAA